MRNPRITWLLNQISEWQDAGIVSPYQAEAIRSRYTPSGALGSRRGVYALIWLILGAGVVALTVVLAITHWWVAFPFWLRVGLACVPTVGSWGLVVGATRNGPVFERIPTEWLAPLNSVTVFISMVILSNLYAWPYGWVSVGVGAILLSAPLLFRFPSYWWVGFVAVALNGLIWGADTFGLRAVVGIAALAISLSLSTGTEQSRGDKMNQLVSWLLAMVLTASLVGISETLHPTAFMLLPLVAWSTILGTSRSIPKAWILRRPVVLISAVGFFSTLFLGGSSGIWNEWVGVSVVETSSYVIALGTLLGVSFAAFGLSQGTLMRWALVLPACVGLVGMIVHRFVPEWVVPSAFSIMAVGASIFSIRYGVSTAKRKWINGGVMALVAVILEKCVSSEWPIGIRLLFLAIAGGALLGVGVHFNSKLVNR